MTANLITSWLLWGLRVSWAISLRNPILFLLYGVEVWSGLFMVTVVGPIAVVFGFFVSLVKLAKGDFRNVDSDV